MFSPRSAEEHAVWIWFLNLFLSLLSLFPLFVIFLTSDVFGCFSLETDIVIIKNSEPAQKCVTNFGVVSAILKRLLKVTSYNGNIWRHLSKRADIQCYLYICYLVLSHIFNIQYLQPYNNWFY